MADPSDDLPDMELLAPEAAPEPKMLCPFCGAEHDRDQQGRFCDGCGLSIAPPPKLVLAAKKDGLVQSLCKMCGSPLRGGKCPSCG